MLKDYTKDGGKLMVVAGTTENGTLPNLTSLLTDYGVTFEDGIVVEADREHYAFQEPFILLPDMASSDITDSLIEANYYPMLPIAQGMNLQNAEESVTALMTTSDLAYNKKAGLNITTYEKEDGDTDGPFAVAVSVDCGNSGRILWFGSSYFLEDQYIAYSSGANGDLAMNGLAAMVGESEAMAIRSKSLNYNYLTISGSASTWLKVIMIGVFPLGYLAVGIYVVMRRRRLQANEAV